MSKIAYYSENPVILDKVHQSGSPSAGSGNRTPIVLDAYYGASGSSTIAVFSAGTYYPIPFALTNVSVVGLALDTTGNYTGRITCTSAGKYLVSYSIGLTDATSTDFVLIGLLKNCTVTGGTISAGTACNVYTQGQANVAHQQLCSGTRFITLAAGDTLMVGVTRITTTGTVTLYKGQSSFSVQYLGV